MVRVVDCHAGVQGLNPAGPKDFFLWNYFTGGSGTPIHESSAFQLFIFHIYILSFSFFCYYSEHDQEKVNG